MLTGIDMPADAGSGSIVLIRDMYAASGMPWDVTALAHAPRNPLYRPLDFFRSLPGLQEAYAPEDLDSHVAQLRAAIARIPVGPEGFDIVHCQHLTFGMSLALVRMFPSLPKIAVCHGTDLIEARSAPVLAEGIREVVGAVDAVVLPARALMSHVQTFVPSCPESMFTVIPWGIPPVTRRARPSDRGASSSGLRVLYAGRLDPTKGFPILLDAMRNCRFVQLSVAGPAEGLRAILQSGYADLRDRVEPLGWLPRDQLFAEFSRHDCIVVTTLTLEAFNLASVEAQAHGLPVVYSRVDSLSETLAETGLAFPPGDSAALGAALALLHDSPRLRAELGRRGLANARRFELSAAQRRLATLSTEVIATRGGVTNTRPRRRLR